MKFEKYCLCLPFSVMIILLAMWTNSARSQISSPDISTDTFHVTLTRSIPLSDKTYELHLIETRDDVYTAIGIRKPEGVGPFPVILMSTYSGHDGIRRIDREMYRTELMMERMLARGYAVAYANERNEVVDAYNEIEPLRAHDVPRLDLGGGARWSKLTPTLDSDDYISIVRHLKSLAYVDRVGTVSISHGAELMHKAASVIGWDAGVAIECSAIEFLAVDTDKANYSEGELQLRTVEAVEAVADKALAMERIRRINMPFLHIGRDDDHLQGLFRSVYSWAAEAGKDVTWVSYDHSEHGYAFLYQTENESFTPDAVQEDAFATWMAFFDRHLQGVNTARP